MEQNKQKTDFGSIVGIILVTIILVIGAVYFFNQRIEKQKEFQKYLNTMGTTTTVQEEIINTATSSNTSATSTLKNTGK